MTSSSKVGDLWLLHFLQRHRNQKSTGLLKKKCGQLLHLNLKPKCSLSSSHRTQDLPPRRILNCGSTTYCNIPRHTLKIRPKFLECNRSRRTTRNVGTYKSSSKPRRMQKPASDRGCKDAQRSRKASWPLPSSHRRSSGRLATPSRGRENVPLGLPRAGFKTGFSGALFV